MSRGLCSPSAVAISGVLGVLCLVIAAGDVHAQAGDGEFQVNSYTSGDQRFPAVAATQGGGFVVVWLGYASPGTDNDATSVQWRRFGSDTLPLDNDFQVNTYTTSYQMLPAVGISPVGEMLIVWSGGGSTGTDQADQSIQGRRFGSTGISVGNDFQINSYTPNHQGGSDVAGRPAGDFVVVWDSFASSGTDGDGYSVQLGRVDPSTGPSGSDLQVNTYTTNWQNDAVVAAAGDGSFVVAWESGLSGLTHGDTIRARRFDTDLAPIGDDFLVNSNTAPRQADPEIAIAADGSALLVWEAGDSVDKDIRGRLYDAAGLSQGEDFRINSYITSTQTNPAVTADPRGGFVVVWQSSGSLGGDTATNSIQGRRLMPDGTPLGEDFQVNLTEFNTQAYPDVASWTDGTFIVVWESDYSPDSDTSGRSIHGRVTHSFPIVAIFADGFESGDTGRWSASNP